MNEYISREDYCEENCGKENRKGYKECTNCGMLNVPTADVQPINYGRWEETHILLCKWIPEDEKEEGHSFYMAEMKCSCCKRYNTVTFVLTLDKPDFCQLCGARMDGDKKEGAKNE